MTIVLILINMCSVMVHVLLTAVYDNSTNAMCSVFLLTAVYDNSTNTVLCDGACFAYCCI